MLSAATGHDLPRRQLLRPLRKQTLVSFSVISKIARGLEEKITVHDPEIAIHRGTDFEYEPAVLHFPGLLNVSRTRNQKVAVLSRITPGNASERFPPFPEFPNFIKQGVGLLQHFGEKVDGLVFLRKADEVAQRLIRFSFAVRQIQRITSFLPKLREVGGRSHFRCQ